MSNYERPHMRWGWLTDERFSGVHQTHHFYFARFPGTWWHGRIIIVGNRYRGRVFLVQW